MFFSVTANNNTPVSCALKDKPGAAATGLATSLFDGNTSECSARKQVVTLSPRTAYIMRSFTISDKQTSQTNIATVDPLSSHPVATACKSLSRLIQKPLAISYRPTTSPACLGASFYRLKLLYYPMPVHQLSQLVKSHLKPVKAAPPATCQHVTSGNA